MISTPQAGIRTPTQQAEDGYWWRAGTASALPMLGWRLTSAVAPITMSDKPLRPDLTATACVRPPRFRKHSEREDGRMAFGSWERLFLSAAIDHFRDRIFEQSATSAQRVLSEHQRPPFAGHFIQEKSLADLRARYEELARMERGYPGSTGF